MDKFVERAKEAVFYEMEGGNDDVRLMLQIGEANSRANTEMGRWQLSGFGLTDCWKGKWQGMFSEHGDRLERFYLILNGYSRVQAIEMKGQGSVAQREVLAPKPRAGLLGMFSGDK